MNTLPGSQQHEPLTPFEDLKGLAVHDADDLLTGHLFGVLTETDTGLIRFLDIELDGKGRHVLIPVGHARVEDSVTGRRIRLRAATLDDLEEVPAAPPPANLPSYEEARRLVSQSGRVFRGDRYYAHPAYDHGGLYAGEHPIVCEEDAPPREMPELQLLSESKEFKLAEGEPDVRGWPVIGSDRETAGTVADLVFDAVALKVRYLVVERAHDQLLLPIGYVDFDNGAAHAPGLTAADTAALPKFEGMPITRVTEELLLAEVERALDARNPFLRVDFSNRKMIA